MEHTKGEWRADSHTVGYSSTIRVKGFALATVTGESAKESADNAKLIAAAPEMLKALKSIVSEHGFNTSSSLKREALEAIKKATL